MRPITLRNPILGVELAGYFYKTSAVTSRLGQRGDSTSRNVQINAQYCASRVQASRYIDGRWDAKRRRAKKKITGVEFRWRRDGHNGHKVTRDDHVGWLARGCKARVQLCSVPNVYGLREAKRGIDRSEPE